MNKKLTTEEFIEKARKIHGDKYDYSLVNYIGTYIKIKIICKEHDIFEQTPNAHLRKQGCPKCSNKKKTTDEFIKESKRVHGNKYNYSITEYKDCRTKVNIICPIHGSFLQYPNSHLRGWECIRCSGNNKKTTDEFIEESKKIHDNKYDYSKSIYINVLNKIIIICPIHGEFYQTPPNHLHGNGCPKCKESKGEKEIRRYLIKNNIKFESQKRFQNCKNKTYLPFDFYLPDLNICIEYNGEQHYKYNNHFGGKNIFKKQQKRDEIKNNFCENNNINLLIIKYNENVNNIMEKYLK